MLASGTGTNLQAILDTPRHTVEGREVEVVAVASDKPDAKALERAREAGVETEVFERGDCEDREARDAAMADWLEERGRDLVVLAGYMQLLSAAFVAALPRPDRSTSTRRCCPPFPGSTRSGRRSSTASRVTGVTVHFVDEGVDSGPIILQRPVEVPPDRDRDRLEREIHRIEHELLPEAIRLIAAGRVSLDPTNPRVVRIEPPQGLERHEH